MKHGFPIVCYYFMTYNKKATQLQKCSILLQWNLSIMDILRPRIFGHFAMANIEVFLFQRQNNVPFGTKSFVLIMEVFSILSLIWGVC